MGFAVREGRLLLAEAMVESSSVTFVPISAAPSSDDDDDDEVVTVDIEAGADPRSPATSSTSVVINGNEGAAILLTVTLDIRAI